MFRRYEITDERDRKDDGKEMQHLARKAVEVTKIQEVTKELSDWL